MSKKAPAIHVASAAAGPDLVPGHFDATARIEASFGSRRS
jgi:hypothetical protein